MSAAKTVFMFSGQGSQYYQMGKQLYDGNGLFREWMLRLDDMAFRLSGKRVLDAIYSMDKGDVFDHTPLTHPSIFMVEYALAQCLIREGVTPDVTLGTSLGSFAAAAVAGHITAEDAMAAIVAQASALEQTCEPGGLIAILSDPSLYDESFLRDHSEMAGINFADHFAVSAPQAAIDMIEATLKQRGISHQRLAVSCAFHSRWIDNAAAPFASAMASIPTVRGTLPVICCERADTLTQLPGDFFWTVVRQPIRFRDTIAQLERSGTYRYIDVGPSGTLATFVKYALPGGSQSKGHAVLTPYGHDQKNLSTLLAAY